MSEMETIGAAIRQVDEDKINDLHAVVMELTRERDANSVAMAQAVIRADEADARAEAADDRIAALERKLKVAEEALELFATVAARYDPPEDDDADYIWDTTALTLGDLRRARAALSTIREG